MTTPRESKSKKVKFVFDERSLASNKVDFDIDRFPPLHVRAQQMEEERQSLVMARRLTPTLQQVLGVVEAKRQQVMAIDDRLWDGYFSELKDEIIELWSSVTSKGGGRHYDVLGR